VGHPTQAPGQAFDVVGECVRRVELGDALDEGIAFDLNSPGGADGPAVGTGGQDARVVDVIGPRSDRAEIGEDLPDFVHTSSDHANALILGHFHAQYGECISVSSATAAPLAAMVIAI